MLGILEMPDAPKESSGVDRYRAGCPPTSGIPRIRAASLEHPFDDSNIPATVKRPVHTHRERERERESRCRPRARSLPRIPSIITRILGRMWRDAGDPEPAEQCGADSAAKRADVSTEPSRTAPAVENPWHRWHRQHPRAIGNGPAPAPSATQQTNPRRPSRTHKGTSGLHRFALCSSQKKDAPQNTRPWIQRKTKPDWSGRRVQRVGRANRTLGGYEGRPGWRTGSVAVQEISRRIVDGSRLTRDAEVPFFSVSKNERQKKSKNNEQRTSAQREKKNRRWALVGSKVPCTHKSKNRRFGGGGGGGGDRRRRRRRRRRATGVVESPATVRRRLRGRRAVETRGGGGGGGGGGAQAQT